MIRTERCDRDAHRLLDGDTIVGFALRFGDGRWGMYDPNDSRIGKQAFGTPKDVAAAFEHRFRKAPDPEPKP